MYEVLIQSMTLVNIMVCHFLERVGCSITMVASSAQLTKPLGHDNSKEVMQFISVLFWSETQLS